MENVAVVNIVEGEELKSNETNNSDIASKEEVLAEIEKMYKNVPNIHVRLVYYALKTIKVIFWDEIKRKPIADDVVQNTIEKILKGNRKWNKIKIPDFQNFVRMAIFSYVRNERKKNELFVSNEIEDENGEFTSEFLSDLIKDYVYKYPADALVVQNYEQLVEKCLKKFENDELAYFVFEEMLESSKSNIKIAEKLKIEIKDVENAKKRIKTKINKILEKSQK